MNEGINRIAWLANGLANRINAKKKEIRWRNEDKRQMRFIDLPVLTDSEERILKETWSFFFF
jgi:hypothetical protein